MSQKDMLCTSEREQANWGSLAKRRKDIKEREWNRWPQQGGKSWGKLPAENEKPPEKAAN